MTFSTNTRPVSHSDPVKDAVYKLMHHPDYKLIMAHLRIKGVKLLNESLRDPSGTVSNSRLSTYAEIYQMLTGKELFDGSS